MSACARWAKRSFANSAVPGRAWDRGIPRDTSMNKYAVWFSRAMWLGIIADWVLGIPAIFAPNCTLTLAGQRPSPEPHWVAFASLLVILLSLFYIPGANDPYRYSVSAWLGVLARPPGVLFFLFLWPDQYPAFGYLDLGLFCIQAPLLVLAM